MESAIPEKKMEWRQYMAQLAADCLTLRTIVSFLSTSFSR